VRLLRRRDLGALALAASLGCGARRRPGEIALWYSYGGKNRKVLLELVDRFHAEQSAIRVTATFQGDYFEGLVKLRTGLYVGSVPTISHVVGEVLPYLAQARVLEPLEGIGDEVIADLDPALSQGGTFRGGAGEPLWALPFNRSTPIAFYNRDLFARLGLTPPATWDELVDVARAATEPGSRHGFACPIDWWFWVALVGQAGGQLIEDDGSVSLGGEAGSEAVALWQSLIHRERVMKPPPGRDYNAWEATNNDFLAERVAMIWTSTAFVRYLEETAKFSVGAAPLPAFRRAAVPTGGTFFVVPRGLPAAERDAGLAFLRWMMLPAQANTWATSTGYLPVSLAGRRQLEGGGYYRDHPNDRVALDQLRHAQPWPWAPELFRVQREALQPRLEAAVLADASPARMLEEARRAAVSP
jgi:sn-glycerol 3-phosphate transport system substrate-binding protein